MCKEKQSWPMKSELDRIKWYAKTGITPITLEQAQEKDRRRRRAIRCKAVKRMFTRFL